MKMLFDMFRGVHPVGDGPPVRGVVLIAFATIACLTMHGVAHAQSATIGERLQSSYAPSAELVEIEARRLSMDYSLEEDVLALRLNRAGVIPDVNDLIRRAENVRAVDDRAVVADGGPHLYIVQMDESGRLTVIKIPKSDSLCRLIPWICRERPRW